MKDREIALGKLFDSVIRELCNRIKSGEATSSDIKNAIQMLKDNHITADLKSSPDLQDLVQCTLPFSKDELGIIN